MFKHCYCATALLVGGLIGANAPAEWRADASRVARTAALAEQGPQFDVAMVFRPFQRND